MNSIRCRLGDMAVVKLVKETCCNCGVTFALPKRLYDACYKNAGTFYCPNGHALGWDETEADRQRRRAESAEQRIAQRDDEIRDLERAVSAQKGNVTKLKRRAAAGACPCCQRTFMNVSAHLANKHPEFVEGQRTCREKLRVVK